MADSSHDALVELLDQARLVIANDGADSGLSCGLADMVLEFHERLRLGDHFPIVWAKTALKSYQELLAVHQRMEQRVEEWAKVLYYLLLEAPDHEIKVPLVEISVAKPAEISRTFDEYKHEIVFRLEDVRPTLTLIKEP